MGGLEATLFQWKEHYHGVGFCELREMRRLDEKNTKLNELVASLSLDMAMQQEIPEKV
jgi:hypothetical protein